MISNSQEEQNNLHSQNEHLRKMVDKQREIIQKLQNENIRLSADRDSLSDKVYLLEKELSRKRVSSLLISPQTLEEIAQADENVSTPTEVSPVEAALSPMLPPRSPYRPSKERTETESLPGSPAPGPVRKNSNTTFSSLSELDEVSFMSGSPPSSLSPSMNRNRAKRESVLLTRPVMGSRDPSLGSLGYFEPMEEDEVAEETEEEENLSAVQIKVIGSAIKPNVKGKEVVSFILWIGTQQGEEKRRVEKLYSDFLTLDAKLKSKKNNRSLLSKMSKLPDKALFSNNAPSKVDQRKLALEQYLQHIVSLPLEDNLDIHTFLNTDRIENEMIRKSGQKEGYLTKRGKNFGGWKTRYFVLNGHSLDYYEAKEGSRLGSIRLINAQIGRQMPGSAPTTEDNVYRHAFLIVEQRKTGSSHYVRHILCANSDEDRDEWVHELLENIRLEDDHERPKKRVFDKPRKLSKGEIRAISAQPLSQVKLETEADMEKFHTIPSVQIQSDDTLALPSQPTPSISSESSDSLLTYNSDIPRTSLDQRSLQTPRPGLVRRSSMGNLITEPSGAFEAPRPPQRAPSPTLITRDDSDGDKKSRNKAHRMTFWGKKMFSSSTSDLHQMLKSPSDPAEKMPPTGFRGFLSRSSHEHPSDRQKEPRVVFGVPLDEAVRISRINEHCELPAIVYRCIEYLDSKQAFLEEGLYRLSGSNATMKALKEKFNQDRDVNLLSLKNEYDVHVVAGLLKMWLRELPTSVLTRENRTDFLHVIDLLDRKDRVNELGRLVSLLPLSNYTLLRALTAHLIRVVKNSDINKMTMRNVSIVFSPTLGIPATIFNLFMSEFEYIFWTSENGDAAPRMMEDVVQPLPGLSRNPTLRLVKEEHGRSNRNSVNYIDGAPNAIVDLEKNMTGSPVLDEDEDEVDDLTLDDTHF